MNTDPTYGEGYDLGVLDGREQGAKQTRGEIVGHLIGLAKTYEAASGTTVAPYGREQAAALRLAADMILAGEL